MAEVFLARRSGAAPGVKPVVIKRMLPALCDSVARFGIPADCLREAIAGVEMDFDVERYETFDDLKVYCHRVASVVGLACIHIWGFRDPRAIPAACQCGLAFQLTNILRDLKEDAARGRVYLPAAELRRFGYTRDDLLRGKARTGLHQRKKAAHEQARAN